MSPLDRRSPTTESATRIAGARPALPSPARCVADGPPVAPAQPRSRPSDSRAQRLPRGLRLPLRVMRTEAFAAWPGRPPAGSRRRCRRHGGPGSGWRGCRWRGCRGAQAASPATPARRPDDLWHRCRVGRAASPATPALRPDDPWHRCRGGRAASPVTPGRQHPGSADRHHAGSLGRGSTPHPTSTQHGLTATAATSPRVASRPPAVDR